ncbi:MAG: flagellar basal body L-ring protein FlgH [Acidobacteriota bacterium]
MKFMNSLCQIAQSKLGGVAGTACYFALAMIGSAALALAQSPGSLFAAGGPLTDMTRDLRAAGLGDLVTIVVSDQASAEATGGTDTSRKSTGNANVTSLFGTLTAGNPLGNLIDFSNSRAVKGSGKTSRGVTLTTTLSARIVGVDPTGLLRIEGTKETSVNSERQLITVRGLIRAVDVAPGNTILSNQIADLSLQVNGKGVVDDAIKRPFILYRILLGLLPF